MESHYLGRLFFTPQLNTCDPDLHFGFSTLRNQDT